MINNDAARPKQKVGVMGVVFMIYAMSCAGAFGIEDMIPLAGPGMTILMLCVIPFIWAIPVALISAELGSALPVEGGAYVWVKRAFGEFWGFQNGFARILSAYVGVPVYIVLAGDYIGTLMEWSSTETYLAKLVLIALFGYLNYRGIKDVAAVGTILGFVIIAAFAAVIVIGFTHVQYNPVTPFVPEGQGILVSMGAAIGIGLWMYAGYDVMANVAGELKDPQVIPKALMIAVPLILLTYIPTTIAGLASVGNWEQWGTDGISYGDVVGLAGYGWSVFFVIVAFLGQISIYNGYVAMSSRNFLVLAEDNLAPAIFTKTNKNGVPVFGWALMILCSAIFATFSFGMIVVITVTTVLFPISIMMLAAIKIRIKEPNLKRPFKVKVGNGGFIVLSSIVPLVALTALYLNGLDYFVFGMAILGVGPILYILARLKLGGLTKVDSDMYPMNPKTRLPQGDFLRMTYFYLGIVVLSIIGFFFLNWYEDPAYYNDFYKSDVAFDWLMNGMIIITIAYAVIAAVMFVIHKKREQVNE